MTAILVSVLFGCEKKVITTPQATSQPESAEEPIQKLARDTAQKIHLALKNVGASTIEIMNIDGHDIFPPAAFSYFENALAAQLAAVGVQKSSGDWKMKGDLSRQRGEILFSFRIYETDGRVYSDSAKISDDRRLQNTVAQFETPEKTHDHSSLHKEMPVPTPLAELKQIPLDVAENCPPGKDCTLLLLYSNELVERNWKDGTERTVPLPVTGLRSRAPSGKLLTIQNTIFVLSNQLAAPIVLNRDLQRTEGDSPKRFPRPEPGLNSYALSDGRFFDFEEFGPKGLAVIDIKYRLSVADQGKLILSDQQTGGTLFVSPPYIYTSSFILPGNTDAILKFIYKDGLVRLEKSQNIDGSVYDIVITDLNRDQQPEMLVTARNPRGIFIEVYEPF